MTSVNADLGQVVRTPVRRLWVAVLCGYLALGATLQELPGYLVERFGEGPAVAGLAVGIAFAATAVVRPFAGMAGDAGRAAPMVAAGAVLTTVAALGHLLAPNVAVLLVARLVMGAGEAALFSAALPWVLGRTPANRRGRVAGWFGLSMWGGLALGPLVAVGAHRFGVTWWVVAALPMVSTALVASTGLRSAPPRGGAGPGLRSRPRLASWRDLVPRGAGLPGLCLGMASYGYGTLTALLVLYLTGKGSGAQGVALTVFAVAFLAVRAAGSPLIDRYGGAAVARVVLGFAAAGLALLAAVPTDPAVLLGTALAGVGVGLMFPATTAMTLQRTHARAPGLAVGAMTSLWDVGVLVAGPAGGLVADHLGYRPAFALAAAVALAALLITVRVRAVSAAVPGR
ncbi:MFS transporter [Pseudonocardia acaciae]|uniref:MFS transporter n=1 Tax=Pseudonocardia acaciae TaxID=551276 RepID=UPI000687790B|nr:MFS transporter [Pseudonocardia acaciae]